MGNVKKKHKKTWEMLRESLEMIIESWEMILESWEMFRKILSTQY